MSTKKEMAEIDQMEAGSKKPSVGKYHFGAANVLFLVEVQNPDLVVVLTLACSCCDEK
jgi:hypothetical protein